MKKMRRIISKTNDGCNFQLTESSVIAFSRAHGLWKIFQSIFVLSRKKSRYQSQLTYGVSFRILVSFRFRSPFQSSITPILPSFSLCKLQKRQKTMLYRNSMNLQLQAGNFGWVRGVLLMNVVETGVLFYRWKEVFKHEVSTNFDVYCRKFRGSLSEISQFNQRYIDLEEDGESMFAKYTPSCMISFRQAMHHLVQLPRQSLDYLLKLLKILRPYSVNEIYEPMLSTSPIPLIRSIVSNVP